MKTWRGAGATATERVSVRPWTDPRLVLGVLLVLGATVLGARLAAASDDAVEYWALRDDVRAGQPVERDDLEAVGVRLDDAGDSHLAVDDELPDRLDALQWRTDAAAGALVRRDEMISRSSEQVRELPLTVAAGATPSDLGVGDLVEVWVGPGPGDTGGGAARRVLQEVRVLSTGSADTALEGSGSRAVLVEVPVAQLGGDVVSTVASGHVTLVRQP